MAAEQQADLLLGNNVLAHVPDLNDFVGGMKVLLKPGGVITMEFPHLLRLIDENQWDTIYHEHFSYLSFSTASRVFAAHGLRLFDVEELPTHGGSLRIFGCHDDDAAKPQTERAAELLAREEAAGYSSLDTYLAFGERVIEDKLQILSTLIELKRAGKRIVGYGAPAKGNTLLNYCGVGARLRRLHGRPQPAQAGHAAARHAHPDPLARVHPDRQPDVVLILPWNLKDEIMEQLAYIREWGGEFAVRTPELTLLS